ncbi:MAG: MFS transporter [Calditrichaeota bacterium]|nr:MAG: MFS transporter [Calditrichota bacterium]
MYDFANSAFSALVLTFIFSTYFTKAIAPDEITGTALWSRGLTISGLTVALLSPFLGAVADRGGLKKRFLLLLTGVAVCGTAALYTAQPGQVFKALALFVIANMAVEMGMVFYNSFLPDIAPGDRIGRISGYGWSFGYVGGLLAMSIAMVGLVETDVPWFGLSKVNGENIRATNLLVAAWIACFSVPLFLWVREKNVRTREGVGALFLSAANQLKDTFHEIRRYRQIVRLLLARVFYNDAILTIFSFGGIYAAGTFGFSFTEILIFGIVLNITAGIGAFALGFLDDVIGGKNTVQVSNYAFMVATVIALFAPTKAVFWVAGIIVGIFSGPNQAASRSLMGRFVPADKESEFFGFYAFSGKATAFVGPLILGILTELFHSQRAGMSVVLLLFAIGSIILKFVDEEEGKRLSGRDAAIAAGRGQGSAQ